MTTIQSRIQHKRDTSSNWEQNNPVILAGEIIIVDTNAGEQRTKTGDGTKHYSELPFDDENIRNLVSSKDAETLASAKSYTDEKIGTIDLSDVVTIDGGGQIQPSSSIGSGPFVITVDEEEFSSIDAESVQFSDGETFQDKYDSGELVGPPGSKGDPGEKGNPGANATINGYNAISLVQGQNVTIADNGSGTFTVSADAAAVKLVRW